MSEPDYTQQAADALQTYADENEKVGRRLGQIQQRFQEAERAGEYSAELEPGEYSVELELLMKEAQVYADEYEFRRRAVREYAIDRLLRASVGTAIADFLLKDEGELTAALLE